MPLYGRFTLTDADYSPLLIFGVGTFMAFSGNGKYRNHGGCAAMPGDGPIPPGKYWIVDRPTGGALSKFKASIKDEFNKLRWRAQFARSEWFALYRDDAVIDDQTWLGAVYRAHFRLHPGHISQGCITLPHNSDFAAIRNALLNASKIAIPRRRDLLAYGAIEVIANANECP